MPISRIVVAALAADLLLSGQALRQRKRRGSLHKSGGHCCWGSGCGDPGCETDPSAWCNSNESACTTSCNGVWCATGGPTPTPTTPTPTPTPPPPTPPTPTPPCADNHTDCTYWAGIGECQANPGYMLIKCPAACGACETPTPTPTPTPPRRRAPTPTPPRRRAPTPTPSGTCPLFKETSNGNCDKVGCGSCFNAGGRDGVMCSEPTGIGYFCEAPSFACMDWSFGSTYMKAEEAKFNAQNGDSVYLGVGTFGSSEPMAGLGACYRITAFGVDRDLILQAVNTGPDVHGNQFDLQMGAGGMGIHNKCAGAPDSIFPGPESNWGERYGGPNTVEECDLLPPLPNDPEPMRAAGDDMVEMCKYSFEKKVRLPPNNTVQPASNPTILNMGRVKCPPAIVHATQLQRSDDPSAYTFSTPLEGFPNDSVQCQSNPTDLAYCLTRMMDCKKPSAGYIDNIQSNKVVPGQRVVQPCTNDGYTRINVQCGCMDCYC